MQPVHKEAELTPKPTLWQKHSVSLLSSLGPPVVTSPFNINRKIMPLFVEVLYQICPHLPVWSPDLVTWASGGKNITSAILLRWLLEWQAPIRSPSRPSLTSRQVLHNCQNHPLHDKFVSLPSGCGIKVSATSLKTLVLCLVLGLFSLFVHSMYRNHLCFSNFSWLYASCFYLCCFLSGVLTASFPFGPTKCKNLNVINTLLRRPQWLAPGHLSPSCYATSGWGWPSILPADCVESWAVLSPRPATRQPSDSAAPDQCDRQWECNIPTSSFSSWSGHTRWNTSQTLPKAGLSR